MNNAKLKAIITFTFAVAVISSQVQTYRQSIFAWQWRHNGRDGVSNYQHHHCLLNRLFTRRSKKTSKLRVTGLCAGNSPGPVNSPHKGPVTRKMFPTSSWISSFLHNPMIIRLVVTISPHMLPSNSYLIHGWQHSLHCGTFIPDGRLYVYYMNASRCVVWTHRGTVTFLDLVNGR